MQPEYFSEQLSGTVWRHEGRVGITPHTGQPPSGADRLYQGEIILRYGIQLLRGQESLILGLFMSEMGGVKMGVEAWQWLWSKFQLYPRAEVIGVDSRGKDAHLYVRDLDFGVPPQVFAYADGDAGVPIARVEMLHDAAGVELPPFLQQYLG